MKKKTQLSHFFLLVEKHVKFNSLQSIEITSWRIVMIMIHPFFSVDWTLFGTKIPRTRLNPDYSLDQTLFFDIQSQKGQHFGYPLSLFFGELK